MISKKIEKYTDSVIQKYNKNQVAHNPPDLITPQDLNKLQIMGSQVKTEDLYDKLIYLKNTQQDKQIEELCYAEIGRKLVKVSHKQIKREFQKANIYIRAYLLRSIYQYVAKLASNSSNTIYILPNVKGLHFSTQKKPDQLQKYLEDIQYVQIIKNINYIIQNGLFANKKRLKSLQTWKIASSFMILLIILSSLLMVCVGSSEKWQQSTIQILVIVLTLVFLIVLISVLGYAMHSFHQQMEFRPLCDKIMDEIQQYFTYINTKYQNKLQWMIGQSFFWIQVKVYDGISQSDSMISDEDTI